MVLYVKTNENVSMSPSTTELNYNADPLNLSQTIGNGWKE